MQLRETVAFCFQIVRYKDLLEILRQKWASASVHFCRYSIFPRAVTGVDWSAKMILLSASSDD